MGSIDPADLGHWFDAHAAALVLYARQWLDAAWAEDAVQEVFIRLMSQRRPPENLKAWLFRSVRNEAISRLRSLRRRHSREELRSQGQTPWFQVHPGDGLDARAAQALLEALPDEQREPVVLRIWGELTVQEIADLIGVPLSTVFARYRAGLAVLRQKMDPGPTAMRCP